MVIFPVSLTPLVRSSKRLLSVTSGRSSAVGDDPPIIIPEELPPVSDPDVFTRVPFRVSVCDMIEREPVVSDNVPLMILPLSRLTPVPLLMVIFGGGPVVGHSLIVLV